MITRRDAAKALAALPWAIAPTGARSAFWSGQTALNTTPQGWSELPIGPGGLVRQAQIADDGTAVCCTDTFGAYIGKPSTMIGVGGASKWSLITTSNSLPVSFVTYANTLLYVNGGVPSGVWDVGIAPGNSSVLGLMAGGYVFISTNGGGTWVQTSGITRDTTEFSNGLGYVTPCSIAFDPANEAICYVGHSQQGVWSTQNATNGAGGTWAQISTATLPVSTVVAHSCGLVIIKFDRNGGTLSSPTRTKNIYIYINGHGVYKSTDGGATWALISGSPTNLISMDTSRDGYLYGTSGGTTTYVYNGTTGTTPTNPTFANNVGFISADPNVSGKLVLSGFDGSQSVSTNHGVSWTSTLFAQTPWLTAVDVPWLRDASTLGVAGNGYTDTVCGIHDPTQAGILVSTLGIGVMVNTPSSASPTYTSVSRGIEQLVCNDLICPPGGTPIAVSWDRPIIKCPGFGSSSFPSVYFPHNSNSGISTLSQGIQADWASDGSGTIIACGPAGVPAGGPGYVSTDNGATWAAWPTQPFTTYGGNVACASSTTWIAFDPATGKLWVTVNAGSSWAQVTGPPTTSWPTTTQPGGQYGQCLAADRVTIGKFYAYNLGGIYAGTVSGSALAMSSVASAPQTSGAAIYYMKFKSAPGLAGNLFAGYWNQGAATPPGFSKSVNGGGTWIAPNTNMQLVYAFDIGATKGGASYPSIWAWGQYSGVVGLYLSNDGAVTWTHVVDATWGNWPSGDIDFVIGLCASKDTYGWVAIGFQGSGYQQGYFPL